MTFGVLLSALPLLGVLAGLASLLSRRVPIVAAGLVVVAYAIYIATVGVWAATCWDCRGLSETRGEVFVVAVIYFALVAFTVLVGIWLGARLATMLQRLRRTWRELRDTGRGPDAAPAGKRDG